MTVRSIDSVAIGKSITTTVASVIELGTSNTTKVRVDASGLDLFDDPHSTKTLFGEVLAFMVYADLEPHRLAVVYD
jgi:hypothetical protein